MTTWHDSLMTIFFNFIQLFYEDVLLLVQVYEIINSPQLRVCHDR